MRRWWAQWDESDKDFILMNVSLGVTFLYGFLMWVSYAV